MTIPSDPRRDNNTGSTEGSEQYPVAEVSLRFEFLVTEMMGALMRAPAEQIDAEVRHQLDRALTELGFERGSITEISPEGRIVRVTHAWAREGRSLVPIGTEAPLALPWLVNRILDGEATIVHSLNDLPPEASQEREFSTRQGIKSHLAIPMRMAGIVFGSLNASMISHERRWDLPTIRRTTLIAEMIGAAIVRRWTTVEIRRLTNESRGAARAMLMGEVTASLAHELNQPLGAILNNAQAASRILAASQPDLEETKAALADIIRDDRRAVEIIRNVRAFLQRSEAQKSPLSIVDLVTEAKNILRHEATLRRIAFRVKTAQGLPAIHGNQTQLLQVLVNLITNAFESVAENEIGPRSVAVTASDHEGKVRVSVSDSGNGIDPKVMPRLFNPFVTSKPDGMGMGLAIARTIVEDHGGQIRATQNAGRGATLEFTLPTFSGIHHA